MVNFTTPFSEHSDSKKNPLLSSISAHTYGNYSLLECFEPFIFIPYGNDYDLPHLRRLMVYESQDTSRDDRFLS